MDALHHVSAPEHGAPVSPAVASPLEVRAIDDGQGVFATRYLPAGTCLFGEAEWGESPERRRFSHLSGLQLQELSPTLRTLFLRFAYSPSPVMVAGTYHPEAVRGQASFVNHSCDPNAGFNGAGDIVALVRIKAGEEVRIDYGTFSVSFDHEFTCGCRSPLCRGRVTRRDWPELARLGLRLPRFMAIEVNRALWGDRAA